MKPYINLLLSFTLLATGGNLMSQGKGKGKSQQRTPSWEMSPVSAPNLHYETFRSDSAKEDVSYLVYLPPAYESDKLARFPVIYWLHGIGGSQQGVPGMCANFTAAISEDKMPPVIVVFANGMIDSFYCDAANAPYPVESMIVKDLIPHVDKSYRTLSERENRMIEGFSMGGFGAAHLGFKYPELFGSVSIIDGALLDLQSMKGRHAAQFERIFDADDKAFEAEHPLTLLQSNANSIKGRTVIRQAVGKIQEPNIELHEALAEEGIEHEYESFIEAGHSLGRIYELLGDKNWEFYRKAFSKR